MDRSAKGLRTADDLVEECPQVEERMAARQASDDAFFLFVMEQSSGWISDGSPAHASPSPPHAAAKASTADGYGL